MDGELDEERAVLVQSERLVDVIVHRITLHVTTPARVDRHGNVLMPLAYDGGIQQFGPVD